MNRRVSPDSPLFLIDGEHCLIKNIKTMKKKTTKSSYESPQVRVRALSLERGFAQSTGEESTAGKLNGSGLYDLSVDNGVNNENSSWGW